MYKAKLILVGEGEVGKTSIIQQFIEQRFNPSYLITIGSDKSMKDLNINGKDIKLEIWDTAGQGKYRKVNKIFMKNTKIALLVYDITDKKSFEQLNNWINHVNEANKNENIIFGIAANKSDLFEQQIISTEVGKKFAEDNKCLFFETSAKDHKSIVTVFEKLIEKYVDCNLNERGENKNVKNHNNNSDKVENENKIQLDVEKEEINNLITERERNDSSSKC
jgi:small GTP-binding protein